MTQDQIPGWVYRVREINDQLAEKTAETARLAAEKREVIRFAAQETPAAEIARLLGITVSRVSQILRQPPSREDESHVRSAS